MAGGAWVGTLAATRSAGLRPDIHHHSDTVAANHEDAKTRRPEENREARIDRPRRPTRSAGQTVARGRARVAGRNTQLVHGRG
jgi:hypothetical protein